MTMQPLRILPVVAGAALLLWGIAVMRVPDAGTEPEALQVALDPGTRRGARDGQ